MEQQRYQVRFDWSTDGATAVARDADVIVWVDAIRTGGDAAPIASIPDGPAVIEATIQTADAAARWMLALQQRLSRRITVAVIAAGATRVTGETRFAVEDLLAAGAVVDRLAARGLDTTSPEAAAAEAAYRALGNAVGHLLSASVSATQSADASAATGGVARQATRIDHDLGTDAVVVVRAHSEG